MDGGIISFIPQAIQISAVCSGKDQFYFQIITTSAQFLTKLIYFSDFERHKFDVKYDHLS